MQDALNFKANSGQMSVDEAQGIVECWVAAIGNKDSVGDIIVPGAFKASFKKRKPRVVWGHDWNSPIGKVLDIYEVGPNDRRMPAKMREAGVGGVYAKVQFNLKSERGREAFANVQFFGEEQEWSIGYKTIEAEWNGEVQANVLKELELYEVSPVLHGANQLTGTISIKQDKLKDPKGGLTAAGRRHFNRTEGSNLKPGVKGPADTPQKMRRKGSFLTRFFTNPSGPMKKPNGEPTRLALSAAAWGEPVPKNRSDAAKLAAKGRRLLERYENSKKKDANWEDDGVEDNYEFFESFFNEEFEEIKSYAMGEADFDMKKAPSVADLDIITDAIGLDPIPQERITGDVLRGYGPRRGNLERLLRYWRPIMRKPGGFRRCRVILADHPELYPLENLCAWLHHETTGLWPNEGCHHPGMKNCRNKPRKGRGGSLWSNDQWESRLRKRFAKKKDAMWDEAVDEKGHGEDDEEMEAMISRFASVLAEFAQNEPDFVEFLSNADNWVHEGQREDDDEWEEHEWLMPMKGRKPGSCGCGCDMKADGEMELKAGLRTIGASAGGYDPDAIDGDMDGMVQDSTPFERPAVAKVSEAAKKMGDLLDDIAAGLGDLGYGKERNKNSAERREKGFDSERVHPEETGVGNIVEHSEGGLGVVISADEEGFTVLLTHRDGNRMDNPERVDVAWEVDDYGNDGGQDYEMFNEDWSQIWSFPDENDDDVIAIEEFSKENVNELNGKASEKKPQEVVEQGKFDPTDADWEMLQEEYGLQQAMPYDGVTAAVDDDGHSYTMEDLAFLLRAVSKKKSARTQKLASAPLGVHEEWAAPVVKQHQIDYSVKSGRVIYDTTSVSSDAKNALFTALRHAKSAGQSTESAAQPTEVKREYTDERREEYAKRGYALPDGSFPIRDVGDLRNAIQAFGRAKDKEAAKKHIMKRARQLGATELLPGVWKKKS